MESLRFVHAADLHLDSRFRGIGRARPALRDRLQSATLGALERVVDHTISVKATDAAQQVTTVSLTFTINVPPVSNAGGNQTLNEGSVATFDGSSCPSDTVECA